MENKNKKDTLSLEYIDIISATITDVNTSLNQTNDTKNFKQIWKNIPKSLFSILLLEVMAVYALLFFISPTQATLATPAETNNISISDTLIALTNQERDQYDLNHLELNAELSKAAATKAAYILDNNNFSHEGLNGETFSTWIKQTDYQYKRVGENLAINFSDPKDIMSAWLKSPLHRKNILNPLYDDIGIAVIEGSYNNKQTIVVVQIFGKSD